MRVHIRIITAGAFVGFLGSFSIWFVPEEPYQNFIVAAGTLNGAVTALLVAMFVNRKTSIPRSLTAGALLGFTLSATVFLAKGGWASWDAPFVVPVGVVEGLILGMAIRAINSPASA